MKLSLLAAAAACSLAGCSSIANDIGNSAASGAIAAIENAVQDATAAACKFVPTATTIANIIAAENGVVQTAEAIAAAICASVPPPPASLKKGMRKRLSPGWTVNIDGRAVAISGYYTR